MNLNYSKMKLRLFKCHWLKIIRIYWLKKCTTYRDSLLARSWTMVGALIPIFMAKMPLGYLKPKKLYLKFRWFV